MQVGRPVGHEETIQRLWRAAAGGRLPHAILFEGPAGIGKFVAARWFAQGMLCREGPGEPCGRCAPCRQMLSGGGRGNHPDLLVIDALEEGEERIRIGRIAARGRGDDDPAELCLEAFLSLRPLEGAVRVVLVREAHRMNAAAQNAFLKTLEEPRPGNLIVLETHRPAALLQTLKSRCIRLRFEALARERCEAVLSQVGLEPDEARALARLGDGSPGQALVLARSGAPGVCARLAAVLLGERRPLDVASEMWALEGEFHGKTESVRARERARVVLEMAQGLVRDALRVSVGADPHALPHGEVAQQVARRAAPARLRHQVELLGLARADVERNLAPEALLERALLALADGEVPTGR